MSIAYNAGRWVKLHPIRSIIVVILVYYLLTSSCRLSPIKPVVDKRATHQKLEDQINAAEYKLKYSSSKYAYYSSKIGGGESDIFRYLVDPYTLDIRYSFWYDTKNLPEHQPAIAEVRLTFEYKTDGPFKTKEEAKSYNGKSKEKGTFTAFKIYYFYSPLKSKWVCSDYERSSDNRLYELPRDILNSDLLRPFTAEFDE